MTPPLRTEGVSIRFGGLAALDAVTLATRAGAVTGLIGPNGAGKTTLFDVITGVRRPTSGHVYLEGHEVTGMRPDLLARRGIARTFQRLEPFGSLTVADNVRVALEAGWAPWTRSARRSHVMEILQRVELADVADFQAGRLSTGRMRRLELARVLALRPKVLLLDEPSAGLDAPGRLALAGILLQLVEDDHLSVLVVEHDMGFVKRVCTEIVVLEFGRVIARGSAPEIATNPLVREAYLGHGATTAHTALGEVATNGKGAVP